MVVNFVLPVVMKIGECLVAPVGRQFGYLIFYDRNIENLRKQIQKLQDKRSDIQGEVDAAKSRSDSIKTTVSRWLTQVDELSNDANKFFEDEVIPNKGCLNGWCPNLKSRYSLSRKATKKTQGLEELFGDGNFSGVSIPAVTSHVGTTFISMGGFNGFESRRSIMNEVMEALTDDSINVIGICGMGGVGKTTMVKEVAKKAEEKKMFDIIVMVVVSQNPNLINIQSEIAKILDLKNFEGNNLPTGAGEIRSKILKSGRVLVILDDVWDILELNEIGIPFGDDCKSCKIVLTSRSEDVCNSMNTQKNFMVPVLPEEEAWNLFKEKAAIPYNDMGHTIDFQSTQMAVAKECGGLPISIVTVGRALKGKGKPSWDSALEQLRKSIVNNIKGVYDKVIKSLELSYNFLESKEAKKCFLLCSLYPEDFAIPIEDLVRYAIGIELFERIDSVNQARNRVYSVVDDLKKCYLLMESEKVECIKMHDVIRDVAISIASREEHSIVVRCDEVLIEWPKKDRLEKNAIISLKVDGMHGLPGNLEFPNLHLLKLDCNAGLPPISFDDLNKGMEEVKVQETQDSFYQGMKELKVLALSDMYGSLPTSLRCLTNLRTLSLFHCRLIDDGISVIGALENLEILRFGDSYIKELPKEIIGHRAHLKVLDLLGCVVERIYPGVLSSLSKLEELYVGSIFRSWCEVEESKEGAKAIIDELASLSNLVALDIALINISFWPRGLVIEKLKKFNIRVGISYSYIPVRFSLSNRLVLEVENMSDIIETRLNFLWKSTEILILNSSVKGLKILCDLVGEGGFECLTYLSLSKLYDLEYLINTADGVPQSAFPVLDYIWLYGLDNFKGITSHESRLSNKALWKGPTQLVWFGNLTSVEVVGCDILESMFSLSIARDLVQLQDLEIIQCPMMKEIVSSEAVEHEIAAIATDKIEFPKLKILDLELLPSLTAICKAMNAIELPQLSSLSLSNMPKLKRLCPASDSESNCDPIIQPLFNDKDKLATIEELTIRGMENLMEIWPGELEAKLRKMTLAWCHKLSSILFPSNSIKGMQNLEVLEVKDCRSIGVAFDLEGLVWEGMLDMALPSLKKVELRHLQKLTHVWKDNSPGIQGFQNLRSLVVNECDSLRNLFSYSLAKLLVKLQEIEVTECGMMESIIGNETNAGDVVITNMIMFPQLSSLKLNNLPNLTSFCFEPCTFEGSLLKTIEVINCPKMKILPSAFQRKLDQQKADFSTSSPHHLLDGKFIFSDWFPYDFGKLAITDINGSIEMWHNQHDQVKFMLVQFCGKLSYVISWNLIQRLQYLQRLKVWYCDSLETIFDLQGSVRVGTTGVESIVCLGDLKLMYLPKLMHIWKNVSQQTHCFKCLKSLEVERCDNLRYLFTISMVKVLECLNYLRIGNCEKVEKIVTREAEKEELWSKINILNVELENLPSLVCIGIP
ncbi:disease resistance protein SUMM2-like [Camellia sinensis]|uniref:disease resistance protein SUMM2-like n=1 Tax=Camellia sinensis TaxID=4442 RepID=UPI0010366264|nr:disease resistance protein SUMM2-like [Camellia sinensis]XP_028122176.1 disease resistance protein SUMM2-like [Camellia sinensis]XP_028122177.1 disease resistance protein SUMM2-like [Camellia sinensis]